MKKIIPFIFFAIFCSWTSVLYAQFSVYETPAAPAEITAMEVQGETIIIGGVEGFVFTKESASTPWIESQIPIASNFMITSLVITETALLASVGAVNSSLFIPAPYRSTDGGETWTQTTEGLYSNPFTGIPTTVFHKDGNTVFALLNANIGGVYKSTNDGESWVQSAAGLPETARAFTMARVVDTLYTGTDTGVYRSMDDGSNWEKISDDAMNISVRGLTHHNGIMYLGNSVLSNGDIYKSTDYGRNWTTLTRPSGFGTLAHLTIPDDDTIIAADLYSSAFISTDGGGSWERYSLLHFGDQSIMTKVIDIDGTLHMGTRRNLSVGGKGGFWASTDNGETWTLDESKTGTTYPINSLTSLGDEIVAGTTGGHYITTDFSSWAKFGTSTASVIDVDVRSGTIYTVINESPWVLISSDNGESWIESAEGYPTDISATPYDLFVDGSNIFIGAIGGLFMRSDDTSAWVNVTNGLPSDDSGPDSVHKIKKVSGNLYALTGRGIFYSSDGGTNWEERSEGLPKDALEHYLEINDITSIDGILYASMAGSIFKSDDQGMTWTGYGSGITPTSVHSSIQSNGNDLYFSYSGFDLGIYKSSDFGENWSVIDIGISRFKARLTHDDMFILAGSKVAVVDGSATSIEIIGETPDAFVLNQNFPNPFNPSTIISFQLPMNSDVNLEVFNMLGQRVAILISGYVEAGSHDINFDAGNLSSGIYIYRMTTEMGSTTRKMSLVK